MTLRKMQFNLPKPPSTNHIYGLTSRGGHACMYITGDGKKWFLKAAQLIKEQNIEFDTQIVSPIAISIKLFYAGRQDVDGIAKPTLDAIAGTCLQCLSKFTSRTACKCGKKASLLKNDDLVTKLTLEKVKCKKGEEHLEIELTPLVNS